MSNPWEAVLQIDKDTLARKADVSPGVTVGSVDPLALLKMAIQYPAAERVPFSPAEEYGHGDDTNYC